MRPRSHANANSRIAAALQVRVDPRLGGILLHGFGDTGDMWAPLVAVLVKGHTVIVSDLRGMGLSAHPNTGYTKKNQALDSAGVMDTLKVDRAALLPCIDGARTSSQTRSRLRGEAPHGLGHAVAAPEFLSGKGPSAALQSPVPMPNERRGCR